VLQLKPVDDLFWFHALAPGRLYPTLNQEEMVMKTTLAIALAAGLSLVAGCRQSDPRIPQASGTADKNSNVEARGSVSTSETWEARKERAEAKMNEQLKKLDAQMEELKAKAEKSGDKAKAEWEQHKPKLESQRAQAAKKLDELRATSKEQWAEVQDKTEAAFSELEEGFKDAWARLKE
jgi:hypothetical protein